MILSRVEESLRGYVTENPDADYAALIARFGSPRQIAESSLSQMEGSEVLRNLHIRKRILRIILVAASLLVIIRLAFLTVAYIDHLNDMGGYAVVEIIEVEEIKYEDDEP